MKMVKHYLVAALVAGASTAVYAQNSRDSTAQSQPTTSSQAHPSHSQGKEGALYQPDNQFNGNDYKAMPSSDVPASLRTTLKGKNYKGWESGQLYRHNTGNWYYLSTGEGDKTKRYYFDKNGKESKGTGATSKSGKGGSKKPQPR